MATVFITQNPMRRNVHQQLVYKFDLAPAREYGNLEVLLPAGPVLVTPDLAIRKLRERLQHFQPDDWLLCLGDPVVIAAASAIVAEVNDGVIPTLVFDRQIKRYLSIKVDTNALRNAASKVAA